MGDSELEYIEHIKGTPMRLLIVSLETSSPHWHEEYEVVFVLRGSVFVGGEVAPCELSAGDILLVNPCQVHEYRQNAVGNVCLILQFSPAVIAEVYDKPFTFHLNTATDGFLSIETRLAFQRLLAEMGLAFHNKPDGYQFTVKSGLYAFVGLMFRYLKYESATGETAQSDDYLRDFDAIKRFIKEHFREDIDQERIGRELGMSRAKIYRVLKSAGGASTKDITNFYRVERAKHLLKSSVRSISQIAQECGFESDSSFYRVFRKLTSVTPQDYRHSPAKTTAATSIQGYAIPAVNEAAELLRVYALNLIENKITIESF